MSDTETTDEPQPTAEPDKGSEPDWKAEADKWKALARKHEDASKANADKAKLYDESQEASKTELQKLQDQLAAAQQEAAKASAQALRAQIAQAKGVPAELLSGDTEETLNAAADALLAFRGEAPKPPVAPPAAGQGKVGEPVGAGANQLTKEDVGKMTAAKDFAGIEKARQEGRLNHVLGIS